MLFRSAGCGSKTPPPNQAVKGFMDAMRKTDYLAAGKFVDSKESLDELLTFSEDEEEGKAVVDALMAQVTYKLGSEAITGENATVDVSITAPDMAHVAGAVMAEVMPAAFALAFSGAEDSEKQISVLFMNSFVTNVKDPQVPKVTSDITVKLIKTNDAWFIEIGRASCRERVYI